MHLSDSLSLRLTVLLLNLARIVIQPVRLPEKGTPSPLTGSDYLWAHHFRFSFTPLRCSPSLTVLTRCRVTQEYLAFKYVLPDSDKISRVPPYSGFTQENSFDYRAVTSYGGLCRPLIYLEFFCNSVHSVLQPKRQAICVRLIRFARRSQWRCSSLFLVLDVLGSRVCFSYPMNCIWIPLHLRWWVSFGNLRIKACLQLPKPYRCFSCRPSSAPSPKASHRAPFSLTVQEGSLCDILY